MLVLVDQDGVLADFEQGFFEVWQQSPLQHEYPAISPDRRRHFYPQNDYPEKWHADIHRIMTQAGFFRDLPVVGGAVAGLNAMLEAGHEVVICTAPLNEYQNCVLEKYEWVERHLGEAWTKRMVVTKDKTLVFGDVLVDDRPQIHGRCTPQWQHVLYDQPYNRAENKLRMTWADWQETLAQVG